MTKFTMIAQTSDGEYSEVISAEHPKKNLKQFDKDWVICYDKVCKIDFAKNPVNSCEEQYRLMGKRGWKIERIETEDSVTLP
jgi:hypothetical protein